MLRATDQADPKKKTGTEMLQKADIRKKKLGQQNWQHLVLFLHDPNDPGKHTTLTTQSDRDLKGKALLILTYPDM